ncbi:hypothetical protein NKI55_14365 [Mesorhizobium sp. M0589]
MAGPVITLRPNAVQYLGIAFTNWPPIPHRALSRHGGRVEIEWDTAPATDGTDTFSLIWRELGGPNLSGTTRRGFGSVVLKRVAPQALSGTGQLKFGEQGVVWTLKAPLRSVQISLADFCRLKERVAP